MGFASSITLKDRNKASVTFNGFGSPDSGGASWLNSATDLSAPHVLNIKHTLAKPGLKGVDRHLYQITKTVNDTDGNPYTLTGNFTVIRPRSGLFTVNDVNDLFMMFVSLFITDVTSVTLDASKISSFLNGETR